MKKHNAVLLAMLAIVLALPMYGQETYVSTSKGGEQEEPSMDKPTYETTVVGVHMKVWIMTQAQHKMMMDMQMKQKPDSAGSDMQHEMKEPDKPVMDPMMSGTHHIKVEVSDDATGQKITTGTASVQVMTPTMKNSTVDLILKTDHFGGGLTFDEKGDYQFILTVIVGGVPKTAQFHYTVM